MKRVSKLGLIIGTVLWLVANLSCSKGSGQPARYEKDGIRLTLPSQCTVTKDEYLDEQHRGRVVHIEGPGDAVFNILCVPAKSPKTLDQFAASIAEDRVSRIKEKSSVGGINLAKATRGTSESTTARIQGSEREGIRQRYSIAGLGVVVPHVAEFYMLNTQQYKVVLMTQATDDELQSARVYWQTIFDTLKLD